MIHVPWPFTGSRTATVPVVAPPPPEQRRHGANEPDLVTFTAPCPAGHPAEWTEERDDTRTITRLWCPVCAVGPTCLPGAGR